MSLPTKTFIITLELTAAVLLLFVNMGLGNQAAPTPEPALAVYREQPLRHTAIPDPTEAALEANGAEPDDPKIAFIQNHPPKDNYVIAFLGDSMVETMGPELSNVQNALKERYPETSFSLYNYGIGSENVIEAISRFALPYSYKDRDLPAIADLAPDIIIVGSYAYNPIVPFDRNQQWLLLAELVKRAQEIADNVYLLAEIAPLENGFGEGVNGVNWPAEVYRPHVGNILLGLENAVGLADALDVGLINLYGESKIVDSKYAEPKYVSGQDGIHYSKEGLELAAEIIADSIELK